MTSREEHFAQRFYRNDFYTVGDFDMPLVYRQTPDLSNLQLIGYHNTKMEDEKNRKKTVHFFMADRKFMGVWNSPKQSLLRMKQYKQILSPDFSIYTDMPLARQINSTFCRRWCSAWWQSKGLTVIPAVSWSDKRSYKFCFDGIQQNVVLAVSMKKARAHKVAYLSGFEEMCNRLKPELIICYGRPFYEMLRLVDILKVSYEGNTARLEKEKSLSGQKELFIWEVEAARQDKQQVLAHTGILKFERPEDRYSLLSGKAG